MEEYRFRSDYVALVKFQQVDTQERASELTGCEVFFSRELASEEDMMPTWEMLIDFDVIDAQNGNTIGTIAAIDKQTANILFELYNGILIPANEDLIEDIDTEKETITMNIPEGLLNL